MRVWCKNAPYLHPPHVLAEVLSHKRDRLLEGQLNGRKRAVHLHLIRRTAPQFNPQPEEPQGD